MPKTNFTITIDVATREEAELVNKALTSIVGIFTPPELIKVGQACEQNPDLVRNGLKYISN